MLTVSTENPSCVRDGSGYPFCPGLSVNLEGKCSGQKDSNGQPGPLVFAELEMFFKKAEMSEQKQRDTPK